MTVIVGICEEDGVWMGADSFAGNQMYTVITPHSKLLRSQVEGGGDILLGYAGDFRMCHLLATLPLPHQPLGYSAFNYVAGPLVNALRERLREAGHLKTAEGQESNLSHLLVAYQGRLFSVWDNFEVIEASGYMAIGSGMYIALGALFTTQALVPTIRIDRVLEAVAVHHPYVKRPFDIEQLTQDR